jgi:hypothetical protein
VKIGKKSLEKVEEDMLCFPPNQLLSPLSPPTQTRALQGKLPPEQTLAYTARVAELEQKRRELLLRQMGGGAVQVEAPSFQPLNFKCDILVQALVSYATWVSLHTGVGEELQRVAASNGTLHQHRHGGTPRGVRESARKDLVERLRWGAVRVENPVDPQL